MSNSRYDFACDTVVIGAGVVGLAVARELQMAGQAVMLIEAQASFGMETSSHNSEVIHAGIYYPHGSQKAFHCVRGKHMLYEYCRARSIAHRRLGKLIVASSTDELDQLEAYIQSADKNGVSDLYHLSRAQIDEMEPEIVVRGAIFSPSSGIVDSHHLMLSLLADFEQAGGDWVTHTRVQGGEVSDQGIYLQLEDADQTRVLAKKVVNAAGLYACDLAQKIQGPHAAHIPKAYYAVGHYFTMRGANPFKHLIYPVAGHAHLGVHVTLDLAGQLRFGPDIEWRQEIDYRFDESRTPEFQAAIASYYPPILEKELVPAYTGIRPKISGPDEKAADFLIQDASIHGAKGLLHLYGIESPGLTSCLSIAKTVVEKLQ